MPTIIVIVACHQHLFICRSALHVLLSLMKAAEGVHEPQPCQKYPATQDCSNARYLYYGVQDSCTILC